jgi:hypothetical protein
MKGPPGPRARRRRSPSPAARAAAQGKPRLVAMVPQAQEADAAGVVQLPCGLHLVPLPFSDDLRKLPLPPPLAPDELSQAQQDAASSLVAALTLPPDANPAGRAPNPARHKVRPAPAPPPPHAALKSPHAVQRPTD